MKTCAACFKPLIKGQRRCCSRKCDLETRRPPFEVSLYRRCVWEGECYAWKGAKDQDGYGVFAFYPKEGGGPVVYRAHRASLQIFLGRPIREELVIDHLCRNRACINPTHLREVTLGQNTMLNSLSITAKNILKTHCPQGHAYDQENTRVSSHGRSCRACHRARQTVINQKRSKLRRVTRMNKKDVTT